ncbi:hypothetical protein [Acidiphilium acidophilum]|uniref:hypothetical protein n=1 Tax=Acidiphilium acidophilum TaxID=76588 RepID=UPI002E8E76CD|nr:hypothetical protein [Acidiphilium acidophilum]
MTGVVTGNPPEEPGGRLPIDFGALLLAMNQRQQQQGEILIAILSMLRGEDDKNASNDLIKELMNRIDRQTAMIRALLVSVTSLGENVPATVLRMLRDGQGQGGDDYLRADRHSGEPLANGRGDA